MSIVKGQAEKDKGNAAFKTGDFPTAIGHYSAAIVADPTNSTYPLNRAAAYLKLGKNEDAERDCSSVLKLDPKNVKAMFRRGQARAALHKLREAQEDFKKAMVFDPANDAAKQALKGVEEALKTQSKPRPRAPADVPSVSSISSPSTSGRPKPKRRRIPIEIVEPPATSSPPAARPNASAATARPDDFMTPVSSRVLPSSISPSASSTIPPTPAATSASTSQQPKPTPRTFQEAKETRAGLRPGGGIFRSNGKHTIFGEKGAKEGSDGVSSPADATAVSGPSSAPAPAVSKPHVQPNGLTEKAKAPVTLFAFTRQWDKMKAAEERWSLLNEIPPSALPALFQSSLDASLLASIVRTFRDMLLVDPSPAIQERVRAYMLQLPKVRRFSTIVLFMSAEERETVGEVWDMLDGEQEERRAWRNS